MDHEFDTSKSSTRVVTSALLGFWLTVPLTIFAFSENLVWLITGQIELSEGLIALFMTGCGIYAALTLPLSIANQYNKIGVTKNGIYVRVYVPRYTWKFIEWKDISDVRLLSRLDRWGKSQWLIKVSNLTYWHKVISWQYGHGLEPGIVLNSDLIDREKLLKIIDKQIAKDNS